MKYFILFVFALSTAFHLNAQSTTGMKKKTAKPAVTTEQTATFAVLGNCGMCKKTIEKAALKAGVKTAFWDVDKDALTVTFDPAAASVDGVQKSVAQAGYDNAGYKAPDDAYNGLHGCCQYDRTGAAGGTKTCEAEGEKH